MRTRLFQTESFRLTAIYAVLFVGSMAILSALIYVIVAQSFEGGLLRSSDDDLAAIRRAYLDELPKRPGRAVHEAKEMVDDRLLATDFADAFLIQDGAGKRIAGNLPVMAPKLGVQRFADPRKQQDGGHSDHVILGRGMFLARDLYVFVGRDLAAAKEAEMAVLRTFAWVLLASLVIASVCGLLLSQAFLRRLDAITATCRRIMAGELDDRVPVRGSRNELDQLAMTINDMLDRVGMLMESLKQISNDIAHDLRTPLAHLRYRLERARSDARTIEDYTAAIDAAIVDSDKLLQMLAALLRISQIEAGARMAGVETVELGALLARAGDLYRPVMDDSGHRFEVKSASDASVRGDPQLLLQLLTNLLDNAVHHTPPGTRIALSTQMEGPRPTVVVADQGPGISPADRSKVFRRFYRCEPSRSTPGSGLGLALVSAIVDLHSAEISLVDNQPGLRVVVRFPEPA